MNLKFLDFFLVALGGSFGSLARLYLDAVFLIKYLNAPWTLLIINVAGCSLLGLLAGIGHEVAHISTSWRYFLFFGFCGGFTTFSSFVFEAVILFTTDHWLTSGIFVVGSIVLCFIGFLLFYRFVLVIS